MNRLKALIVPFVAVCLTVSLAIASGQAFWHFLGESSVAPADIAFDATPSAPAPQTSDMGPALAFAPFGSAAQPAETASQTASTPLNLQLRGVLRQSDPAFSSALVAADGKTERYEIGDDIAGRAVLRDIADRSITLEVNGNLRTLGFPNADGIGAEVAVQSPSVPVSNLDRLQAALGVGTGSIEIKDPPPPQTTDDYINMWRGRIIKNPNQVLGEIGLIATEKGYIVDETHDPGVKLAGLRAGDRVARVNGQTVGNLENDQKFFDKVATSGVARLEVVRDEKTFTLSFPLR